MNIILTFESNINLFTMSLTWPPPPDSINEVQNVTKYHSGEAKEKTPLIGEGGYPTSCTNVILVPTPSIVWGRHPVQTTCLNCQACVFTEVEFVVGSLTFVLLCFVDVWTYCLVHQTRYFPSVPRWPLTTPILLLINSHFPFSYSYMISFPPYNRILCILPHQLTSLPTLVLSS